MQVNKFEIADYYNNRGKDNLRDFFKYLMQVTPEKFKEFFKNILEKFKEYELAAKASLLKGILPHRKENEVDIGYYDYSKTTDCQKAVDGAFKVLGINKSDYFDGENIEKANIVKKYIELKEKNNTTKDNIAKTQASIDFGEEQGFKYLDNDKVCNIDIITVDDFDKLQKIPGAEDIANFIGDDKKISLKDKNFIVLDLDNKAIRERLDNIDFYKKGSCEKQKKEKDVFVEQPIEQKNVLQETIEDNNFTVDDFTDISALSPKTVYHEPQKDKNINKFLTRQEKNIFKREYLKNQIEAVHGDVNNTYVQCMAVSKMFHKTDIGNILVQLPQTPETYKKGEIFYINIGNGNKEYGKGIKMRENSIIPKHDADFDLTLCLGDKFPLYDKDGNILKKDESAIVLSSMDLLNYFEIKKFFINKRDFSIKNKEAVEKSTIDYIAGKKEFIVPDGITNIPAGTVSEDEKLEVVNFNHSKINIESMAFSGLPALEKIVNSENAMFDDNAFTNCKHSTQEYIGGIAKSENPVTEEQLKGRYFNVDGQELNLNKVDKETMAAIENQEKDRPILNPEIFGFTSQETITR